MKVSFNIEENLIKSAEKVVFNNQQKYKDLSQFIRVAVINELRHNIDLERLLRGY